MNISTAARIFWATGPSILALFGLAGCGDRGISGKVIERRIDLTSAAFYVMPATDANNLAEGVVTQIYLTNRPHACADLTAGIVRSEQESLFVSAYDTSQSAANTTPTLGVYTLVDVNEGATASSANTANVAQGQLLLVDGNCASSLTSSADVTQGSLALSHYVLASTLRMSLDLAFASGALRGSIEAEWCPAVANLFDTSAAESTISQCLP